MSQDVPQSKSRRTPRSRPTVRRDPQPTSEDLARLGIKVRDFVFESTLPPVRTVHRQPRQIQPSIPSQLHREDTEPIEGSQPRVSTLVRTPTEPVIEPETGMSRRREIGGIFRFTNSGNDLIINHTLPSHRDIQDVVPTPTVTPNGSLHWSGKEVESSTPRQCTPLPLPPVISSNSLFNTPSPLSPLTPSPPRQESLVPASRTPSMASPLSSPTKRRKVSKADSGSRTAVVKRYHLRKRRASASPSTTKPMHPIVHTRASTLSRSMSIRSDRKKNSERGSTPSRIYPRGVGGRGRR